MAQVLGEVDGVKEDCGACRPEEELLDPGMINLKEGSNWCIHFSPEDNQNIYKIFKPHLQNILQSFKETR